MSGALGDRIGRRKMLLWAGALTTPLGSVICALADYYPVLVAGPIAAGIAPAVILMAISLLHESSREPGREDPRHGRHVHEPPVAAAVFAVDELGRNEAR
jgi:MFS family permease